MQQDLSIITNVYNEVMLLPHWIAHHSKLAKEILIIDHNSNDGSIELVKEFAESYRPGCDIRVIPTKLQWFDAHQVDQEAMEVELTRSQTWSFVLNATEFLFHHDLEGLLNGPGSHYEALGFRAYMMIDPEEKPLKAVLFKDRTKGYLDDGSAMASRRGRYMHRHPHGNYNLGRHHTSIANSLIQDDWNLLFAHYSPWPQSMARKKQIYHRRPMSDIVSQLGYQHKEHEHEFWEMYNQELPKAGELLLDPNFKVNYDWYCKLHGVKQ